MVRSFFRYALAVVAALAFHAGAAERNLTVTQAPAAATEKRVALVIGNSAYLNTPLRNPVNDAADMAVRLRSLGFEVIERENLTTRQIGGTLREFRSRLSPGSVALVFYAGHGLQINGENYLPAVDAEITSEEDVQNQSLSVKQVMDVLDQSKTRLNLVFLDACRNNPYARSFRSNDVGLAKVSAPSGTLISYATRPGSVAADGAERNGLYTSELLNQMQASSLPIEQVLKHVASNVESRSNGRQEPWIEGSIKGDFCFTGCGPAAVSPVLQPAPPARIASGNNPSSSSPILNRPTPVQSLDPETALWGAVERGNTSDDYGVYLQQYPKGKFAALARQRMQKLKDELLAEAMAAEEAAWQAAESSGTEAGYQSYLATYPHGRYAALAGPRMAKLAADARLREENDLWNKAQGGNSADMQAYLSRYPTGRYAATANLRLVQLKREEAELRPGKVFKDCADCPEMVVIPAGSFQMGGDKYPDEYPAHSVTIAKPFAMGKTEVTQGLWQSVMGNNPSNFSNCGADCPVEKVSWDDAQEFIRRLNVKTGKQYRLPSEAEWEYACRAGGRDEHCGSSSPDTAAWYNANGGSKTQRVAQKQANAWGLYDMSGNVWEWVQDWYHDSYTGAPADGGAWESGGEQKYRVLRGGSWSSVPVILRAVYRIKYAPSGRYSDYGFRLARMLP